MVVMALCAVEAVAAFQPLMTGFSSAMRLRGSEASAKRPAVIVMNAGIRPRSPAVPHRRTWRGSFRARVHGVIVTLMAAGGVRSSSCSPRPNALLTLRRSSCAQVYF